MQETPWQEYWQKIRPGVFELVSSALAAILVLMAALLPTFIAQHQLFTVENAVLSQMAHWLTKILVGIDSMKFSATIVTFLFWGLIGLVTYGVIMGFVRFWQHAEAVEEIVSEEFVHPAGFNAKHYWRTLALREGVNIAVILLTLFCASLVAFVLLPAATVHARTLVLEWSWPAVAQTAAAAILFWIGIVAVALCLRAWHYRHILRPVTT